MSARVPFEIAISDPNLLKKHWDTLSVPQQVVLKAFNGLPLSAEPRTNGWSELDIWSMLQGGAEFDELGFPTKITRRVPYKPKKYHKLVAIFGRRSGKTDRITGTQIAYEALLGGHTQYVTPGQDCEIVFVAQDLEMAQSHLNFIYQAINSSPLLRKEVVKFNTDALVLKNGISIVPAPPTIKATRGKAIPGWVGDEVGFWYTDPKAANPDYEVERALDYATLQFPDNFEFITSTPYTKEGMLWEADQAGTEGSLLTDIDDRIEWDGVLVVKAPTAAMENPRITRKKLQKLQRKDPEAFIRESLARFVDSLSGYLKPELVTACVDRKVLERPKLPRPDHADDPRPYYVAAMDPAFRHDNFAFTIMHHDFEKGIVQDYFQEWEPQEGIPLNPAFILSEIKGHLDRFGISIVHSDQYQLESLQQLAQERGFTIIGVDFTAASKARIYGNLKTLVQTSRLRLLDNESLFKQLVALEKKLAPGGSVTINAPPGKKDDAASATALCAAQCVWMLPHRPATPVKEKTDFEKCLEQINRNRRRAAGEDDGEESDWEEDY